LVINEVTWASEEIIPIKVRSLQIVGGPEDQGTLTYNEIEDTINLAVSGESLQLGHEVLHTVINDTSSTIINGIVVMITGVDEDTGLIKVAPATTTDPSYILGLTTTEIEPDGVGKVASLGKVTDLDTSGFSSKDKLYIDTTNGTLTNVEPTSGLFLQAGLALLIDDTVGSIYVRLTAANGSSPSELERLLEGLNIGWRLRGRNPEYYGNIGNQSIDLSYSLDNDNTNGATGDYSFSVGLGTRADNNYQTTLGLYNDNKTGTIFEVGIGSDTSNRYNAIEVYYDGTILAPALSNDKIVSSHSLVTKNYIDNLIIDCGVY
jgi:hypothetical protein